MSAGPISLAALRDFDIAGTRVYFKILPGLLEIEQTPMHYAKRGSMRLSGAGSATIRPYKGVPAERLVATELSVVWAPEEAVRLVKSHEIERRQGAQLKAIVDNIDEGIVALRS